MCDGAGSRRAVGPTGSSGCSGRIDQRNLSFQRSDSSTGKAFGAMTLGRTAILSTGRFSTRPNITL